MPYRDGTGPDGEGPRTGMRNGPCGHRRHMGGYHMGGGKGYGFGRSDAASDTEMPMTSEEQKRILKAELEELDVEKQALERRLKELDAGKQ